MNPIIKQLRLLPLVTLVGCTNTPEPMSWFEKNSEFGEYCKAEGLEAGSSDYLACIEKKYQESLEYAEQRKFRTQKAEYGTKHDSLKLWKKNQTGGHNIADGPTTPPPTTTHGITWTN